MQARISLDLKNATYEEVFRAIERQTEFTFFYDETEFDTSKKIDLKVENEAITSVLNKILNKKAISYRITDRHIVLYKPRPENKENENAGVNQNPPPVVVSGTVTDENGEPMIGAIVRSSSVSTNGTVTDYDGKYSISVQPGDKLIFSYIGYAPQTFEAKPVLNVRMKPDVTRLEEVVVVAYGQQKKVSVTAAVSSISTKELRQSPQANLSASLAGRMPGLTAMQSTGQPGADEVKLYLRGLGTTNDSSPLIMIDGVPRDNISVLDPNEVATISILKDASATAVFGVRGANGVILITTRRGEAGKSDLNVSVNYGVQSFLSTMDRVHSWEYAELRNQAYKNDNPNAPASQYPYTQWMIDRYKSGEDPVFFPDRDVINEFFRSFAPQMRLNANFNGGSEDFNYFLNIGYTGQSGNIKTESPSVLGYDPSFNMNRYNFRGNVDYKIAKNLKAQLSLGTYLQRRNSPAGQSMGAGQSMESMVNVAFQNLWSTPSVTPGPITVAGNGVPAGQIVTMNNANIPPLYGVLNRGGYMQATSTALNSSFSLDWGLDFITKGLSARGLIAFDADMSNSRESYRLYNEYSYSLAKESGQTSSYTLQAVNRDNAMTLSKSMSTSYYMNYQFQLNWARSFGLHNLTAMALHQRDNWGGDADLPYNILGFVGRITYNYDDRYLAEFNIGYNGTEQFAPSTRFGTFPAYSAGWVMSNEAFMKDQKIISNLKLRASYGITGNDKMNGGRFLYLDETYVIPGGFSTVGHGQVVAVGRYGNPAVQWEVSKKNNLGIDLELLGSISLTADYFTEHRDKILIQRNSVPMVTGLPYGSSPTVNIGVVDNHGYEAELGYKKIFNKDFSMNVKGNIGYSKNKVIYADIVPKTGYVYPDRSITSGITTLATNYSIGQHFGYMIDYSNGNGYINTAEELASLPRYDVGGGQPRLGDLKYIDVNGDGVINVRDQVPMGYPTVPEISYGINGSFTYKDFDLAVLFNGIGHSSIYLSGLGVMESGTQAGSYTGWHLHAWTAERYANGEKIAYPALTLSGSVSQVPNNLFILNRAFFRLKNVEIGYTLPAATAKKLAVQNARFYVNGNNLWTWKKYPIDTIDPEQSGTSVYGLTRIINFGVNVTF
jgi:TonB-linked SusC/RagA family outer membrane protein